VFTTHHTSCFLAILLDAIIPHEQRALAAPCYIPCSNPRADDESTISRSVSFGQANRRLLPATSVLGRRVVCLSTIPDNFITKFTYDLDRDQGSPSLQQMVYTYYLYKIKEKRTDLQCSASLAPKRTAKNFYPST